MDRRGRVGTEDVAGAWPFEMIISRCIITIQDSSSHSLHSMNDYSIFYASAFSMTPCPVSHHSSSFIHGV